jgi:calcineurin-like phosphoesterase family protein
MADLFLISDTHFHHAAMLTFRLANGELARPGYEDVIHMNEQLISRWNSRVRPIDHVYHLGDVGFGSSTKVRETVLRLNGIKRLVRGNHDNHTTKQYLAMGFEEIHGLKLCFDLWLTHAPIHPNCMGKALGNVHGHIHALPSPPGPYLNVCVEHNAGLPVSLEEARAIIRSKRQQESLYAESMGSERD